MSDSEAGRCDEIGCSMTMFLVVCIEDSGQRYHDEYTSTEDGSAGSCKAQDNWRSTSARPLRHGLGEDKRRWMHLDSEMVLI